MPNKNAITVNVTGISAIEATKLEKLAKMKKSTVETMVESAIKNFLANGCKLPVLATQLVTSDYKGECSYYAGHN